MSLSAHVSTAAGRKTMIIEGSQLVFGRGPGVDLEIAAGRGLSRRAGVVTAMPAGVWIANISRTHALYVEGNGYRIRLPRMEDDSEPAEGWFVHAGTAYVGSKAMFDEEEPLAVTITGRYQGAPSRERWMDVAADRDVMADGDALADGDLLADGDEDWRADDEGLADGAGLVSRGGAVGGYGAFSGEGTLLPFYIDPMTKLFLVALLWCRPWLLDQSATRPLPRTPEIARGALEVTGAYHELERFDSNPEFRDVLSARVAEHIKVLRRKISDHGLAGPATRLSDEVAVRILIDHGIITSADLGRMDDPTWRSRQEDLWWTQG